jgi:peptidoglycan/xylan/chitin deacetylase (PgdA/CDA1 family)
LLYCSWEDRDSLLVTREQFVADLQANYAEMKKYGVYKSEAPFFMPPYEWYNDSISAWTTSQGLQLINFTSGTLSHADWTYPALGAQYRSSQVIWDSIINYEAKHGLNGFILLTHVGTDPRRADKFYNRLDALIQYLSQRGYEFHPLSER